LLVIRVTATYKHNLQDMELTHKKGYAVMSKKAKKADAQTQEITNAAKENGMEVSSADFQEVVPATIVDSNEIEVFGVQLDAQNISTEAGNRIVEGPVVVTEVQETQPVEQTAQPEEKPAPKPKVNKRPYITLVTEHLEVGDFDRKELVKLVLAEFPTAKKGGIETFLTDTLNPKYSHFKERKVSKTADGKLIFTDKLIPAVIIAEQNEQTEAPAAEVVALTEEEQPEQAGE